VLPPEVVDAVRRMRDLTDRYPNPLIEAVLELADWYTLFDKPRRANPLYAHAYEMLAELPGADAPGFNVVLAGGTRF
jgi:hypothetical protein